MEDIMHAIDYKYGIVTLKYNYDTVIDSREQLLKALTFRFDCDYIFYDNSVTLRKGSVSKNYKFKNVFYADIKIDETIMAKEFDYCYRIVYSFLQHVRNSNFVIDITEKTDNLNYLID